MNKICMIIRQQQLHYSEQEQGQGLNIERRHTDGHTHCEICNIYVYFILTWCTVIL